MDVCVLVLCNIAELICACIWTFYSSYFSLKKVIYVALLFVKLNTFLSNYSISTSINLLMKNNADAFTHFLL